MQSISLQYTEDTEVIKYVLNHTDIVSIAPDEAPVITSELIKESLNKSAYFSVYSNEGLIGLFAVHDEDENGLEVHINMLKIGRGQVAIEAAKEFINSIFTITEYTRLIAKVPTMYLNVINFVSTLGFKMHHLTEEDYIKNGNTYDVITFYLEKY